MATNLRDSPITTAMSTSEREELSSQLAAGTNSSLKYDMLPEPTTGFVLHNCSDWFCGAANVSNESAYYVTGDENVDYFRLQQTTVLIILFVFIIAANLSVLIAILLSKHRKSRMNFFIMHLAVADLATGLFSTLPDIIWRITVAWHGGNVVCKTVRFLQNMATYASTYVLVALTIDRLDAIARPMHFQGSGFRAKVLISSAWLISICASIPMAIISKERVLDGIVLCWIIFDTWQWQVYVTIHALFVFILPALAIACCYSIIVYILWSKVSTTMKPKHRRRFTKRASNGKSTREEQPPDLIQNGAMKHQDSATAIGSSSRGLLPRARVKTIKMTFVIVFVFILCWTPMFTYNLLDVYGMLPDFKHKSPVSNFIQSLSFLNSAANPIIYCLFSTTICSNWRRIGCCDQLMGRLRCCKKRAIPEPTFTPSEYTLVECRSSSRDHRSVILKGSLKAAENGAKGNSWNKQLPVKTSERTENSCMERSQNQL